MIDSRSNMNFNTSQMAIENNQRRLLGDYTQEQGPHHFYSIMKPAKGVKMKPVLL